MEERALAAIARLVRPFYDVEGLAFFKDKFAPRWEPRYVAVPSRVHLLGLLLALARLHLGSLHRAAVHAATGVARAPVAGWPGAGARWAEAALLGRSVSGSQASAWITGSPRTSRAWASSSTVNAIWIIELRRPTTRIPVMLTLRGGELLGQLGDASRPVLDLHA